MPTDSKAIEGVVVVRTPKVRGAKKLTLQMELAKQEKTHKELAQEYGVGRIGITQFARRYKAEIAAIRAGLLEEVLEDGCGLWIAEKRMRLAEHQDTVEYVDSRLAAYESGINAASLIREKTNALRATAEELGQIPEKPAAPPTSSHSEYVVKGVSTDELQARLT
jgi:hypothetical protein